MKPHWSESAVWQFLGVVLSALGQVASLLPESQRLLGNIITLIGMAILSWIFLRKPTKRITQQLTRNRVSQTLQAHTTFGSSRFTVRRRSFTKEEHNAGNHIPQNTTREKLLKIGAIGLAALVILAVLAASYWEVSLIQNYLDGIFPGNRFVVFNDESAQYITLLRAYNKLYDYAEFTLNILAFVFYLVQVCILILLIEGISSLCRKVEQWIRGK